MALQNKFVQNGQYSSLFCQPLMVEGLWIMALSFHDKLLMLLLFQILNTKLLCGHVVIMSWVACCEINVFALFPCETHCVSLGNLSCHYK